MSELEKLKVADIMTREVATVAPDDSLETVVRTMKERDVGSVVVVDADRKVVGIVTERDLVRRAGGRCAEWHRIPVAEIMSSPVNTVTPDDSWASVALKMDRLRVRHLPVTEGDRLVGIITFRELLRHRAAFLEAAVRDRTRELEARNAELTARERMMDYYLRIASRIQRQLLPRESPRDPRLKIAVWYEPVDRVSGDFYDYRWVTPDCIGVIICDASGHGIPAAFVSVIAQTVFRTGGTDSRSPAFVLGEINRHLRGILEQERFVTGCYGLLNLSTGRLRFAKAGHPPPLWYRATERQAVPLDAQGMLLGISEAATFEEVTVELASGDRLFLYTDGLLETWNEQGEILGMGRLRQWVSELGHLPPEEMLERIKERVNTFRGHRPFSDDLTVVVLGYERSGPRNQIVTEGISKPEMNAAPSEDVCE